MKLPLRLLCCLAVLLTASMVSAANVVPGMEVVVLKGSMNVFRGVTDGRGRFETGPLEPGVYTVEVRTVPNTPPTSAQFFLSLAGAKPLGEATIRPGVALSMNAMVRNLRGIRGQVSARGGIVYVPRVPNPSGTPPPAPAVNPPLRPTAGPTPKFGQTAKPIPSNRPVAAQPPGIARSSTASAQPSPAPVFSPDSAVVPPAAYPPKIIDGRRHFWIPIAPGNNLGRWLPENPARPGTVLPSKSNPSRPAPSPSNRPVAAKTATARSLPAPSPAPVVSPDSAMAPPGAYPPKVIDGRRYFWVPIAPGNNLGRWLPENPARPGTVVPPKSNPSKPATTPTPSRTRR